jgi:hypothetical protein
VGEYEGQFRLPGGMAVPLLALIVSIWLMTHASLKSWLVTAAFMAVGSLLYLFTKRGDPPATKPV